MKSRLTLLLLICCFFTAPVLSQKLSDYAHIGITFGMRCGPGGKLWNKDPYSFTHGYIRTTDSTLQLSSIDHGAFVISTGVLAFPFMTGGQTTVAGVTTDWVSTDGEWWRGIGFIANLNVATIGLTESDMLFNQRAEGGIGVVYSFGRHFALSLTYEKYNNRRLYNDYFDSYVGKKLPAEGEVITDLDQHTSNTSLFRDDYVNAYSIKLVIDIHQFEN